jgi:uncharacterized protein
MSGRMRERGIFCSAVVVVLCLLSDAVRAQESGQLMTADHPYLPKGYHLVAQLDCGKQIESEADGAAVRQRTGKAWTFDGVALPLGTAAFHEKQVEFAITGLKQDAAYVLGFTWWDADSAGREQSVRFRLGGSGAWTTVLGPTPAVAYYEDKPTWARALLPIPAPFRAGGRLDVGFAREGGPNAVVSELWLLERTGADARKRVLLVTGDDYPGHRWRETAPELAAILREDPRLEVSVAEIPAVLGSPLLAHYDAVVLHFKNYAERLPLGEAMGSGLDRFARSGKGVVLSHFACGAFQEWDGFVNVAGRVWNPEMRGHDPRGPFTVNVADSAHPITASMLEFTTTDELYTCLDGDVPIHVLCQATSKVDEKVYAIAFVRDHGEGRVFHCTLGHDLEAFESEGARALYRRATAWAAGLPPTPD